MASELPTRDGLYGLEYRELDQRRVDSSERKTYDIKSMWQRHHEIVNLAATGMKEADIARVLNITLQTVSNTLNSMLGKTKLSELRQVRDEETRLRMEQIQILTDKALATYYEVFENPSGEYTPKDKIHTADTVLLELSGMRVPTKIHSASITMTPDDLREIKERGLKAMREAGMIVDVEPEAVNE